MGLKPYTSASDDTEGAKITEYKNTMWTLKEAMRTFSFWGMLYCQMLLPMITTGIVFHFISIMSTKGLSEATASFVLSLLAIVSFPTTLFAGYLLDCMKMHHATAIISLLLFLSLVVLLFANSIYTIILFAVIQGSAIGLQSVSGGIVWPNYYGMRHLGSIRALAMVAAVISSAIGPIPFGYAYDILGSYLIAFIIMMFFSVIGIIVALFSSNPNEKALL